MGDNISFPVRDEVKQFVHMWNSFVKKHRVHTDTQVPGACKAFTKLHAPELVESPALTWCWRLFRMNLFRNCLLDARTMNECKAILEQYQKQNSDPKG